MHCSVPSTVSTHCRLKQVDHRTKCIARHSWLQPNWEQTTEHHYLRDVGDDSKIKSTFGQLEQQRREEAALFHKPKLRVRQSTSVKLMQLLIGGGESTSHLTGEHAVLQRAVWNNYDAIINDTRKVIQIMKVPTAKLAGAQRVRLWQLNAALRKNAVMHAERISVDARTATEEMMDCVSLILIARETGQDQRRHKLENLLVRLSSMMRSHFHNAGNRARLPDIADLEATERQIRRIGRSVAPDVPKALTDVPEAMDDAEGSSSDRQACMTSFRLRGWDPALCSKFM